MQNTTTRLLRGSADVVLAQATFTAQLIEQTIDHLERIRADIRSGSATLGEVEGRVKLAIMRLEGP